MRDALVQDLEDFVRDGDLWDEAALAGLVGLLEAETNATGDPIPAELARPFRSLLVRIRMGDVPKRLAIELEGIVYPRLWKVMEASRDGLPEGELRTRIEVFNRRLSRRFAQE